jgi:sulfate transport system ATP-binding protein
LEIERHPSNGAAVPARIHRIQSAGPIVRIELTSDEDNSITVEMTHELYRDLTITTGELVFVKVREKRSYADII